MLGFLASNASLSLGRNCSSPSKIQSVTVTLSPLATGALVAWACWADAAVGCEASVEAGVGAAACGAPPPQALSSKAISANRAVMRGMVFIWCLLWQADWCAQFRVFGSR